MEPASLVAGLRILLADDSDFIRIMVLSFLKDSGVTIDVAEDGAAAVRLFDPARHDVVLMDIEMPEMDGYAAVREMRRIDHARGAAATLVLGMSAHAAADISEQAFAAGFTDLLTK